MFTSTQSRPESLVRPKRLLSLRRPRSVLCAAVVTRTSCPPGRTWAAGRFAIEGGDLAAQSKVVEMVEPKFLTMSSNMAPLQKPLKRMKWIRPSNMRQ